MFVGDAFRQRLLHIHKINLLLKTEVRDLTNVIKKRSEYSKKIQDEKIHMEVAFDKLVKNCGEKDSLIEELQNTVSSL